MALVTPANGPVTGQPGAPVVGGATLAIKPAGSLEVPEHVQVTTLDAVVNWCRKYSLWPMPFATACCGIELMAVGASRFDIARFGAEVMRFSPRQCDLMIVAGRVAMKMMPVLQRIWLQMPEPKWCISMGACASTGGVFDTYAVVQGIDRFIPVDVYIPGCPPRPEQILRALMDIQEKIQKGGAMKGTALPEMIAREKYLAEACKGPLGPVIATERGDEDRFGYRLPGGPARLGADESSS
jgi:NADH-quinone oxidoreductase subunit B